jgi:hypothetical protein
MYTPALLIALSGLLTPMMSESPSWQTDYDAARKLGREERKPLAIFVGAGRAGWDLVSEEGKLAKEAKRILAASYVCVYIDRKYSAGKQLAGAFEISEGVGLIISDCTGQIQAFWHDGDLADDDLVRYLRRYADPDRVIHSTETNPAPHVSYYYPADEYRPHSSHQRFYFTSPGGGHSC